MTKEEFKQIRAKLRLSPSQMGKLVGENGDGIRRFESGEWPVSKVVRDKLTSHLNKLKKEKEL